MTEPSRSPETGSPSSTHTASEWPAIEGECVSDMGEW